MAYRRFVYMNAFLQAIYSGISTVQKKGTPVQEPIDPTNYFKAIQEEKKWQSSGHTWRKENYPTQRGDNIEIETLDHSLEILQKCDTALGQVSLGVLSLVYTACHQFSRHQFSSAHLIAWTIIEAIQNFIWLNLQMKIDDSSGGHTKFNKDRKDLLAGRDYTASVVSQILSVCKEIDDETLERLNEARRKRNKFVHGLSPIESNDAGKAIRLATDMITSITGVRVTSQLSFSSSV